MSDASRFGLQQATLEQLNSVFTRYGAVQSVLIYGSRAKGDYRPGSDIDLVIKGDVIPFDEFMSLENQIDELMLPYTVDLSQYRTINNPELIAHIDRVGVEVFKREDHLNVGS